MADKLKNLPLNGIKDANALLAKVNEFLKARRLDGILKNVKAPRPEWVKANAKDGKVTVVLEGKIDPTSKKGPLRLTAKAGGQHSVMAVAAIDYSNYAQAKSDEMNGILDHAFG
jgi:hypothetical protein